MYNELLPKMYAKSDVIRNLSFAVESELERIKSTIVNTEAELDIATSKDYLDKYERDLGIATNKSESYDIRRRRILSRQKRIGTVTEKMLKTTINEYTDEPVTITVDAVTSTVQIRFTHLSSEPTAFDAVKHAVNRIIPAHLLPVYSFGYFTWAEYADDLWGDLEDRIWAEIEEDEDETQ